ncbi:hypothetical protein FACS189434_06240 [Bacteroidia bacterium]|nr:hypothetical protein FACS189434_06240 [Bacteroidia bacterium]
MATFIAVSCAVKQENIAPAPVQKERTDKKIFVHLMTWFETPQTNQHPERIGKWGVHWAMDTANPDSIADEATGRRSIATYYYPLTGPYFSGDRNIIEYQLLLMKLAGIDGIIFDYTTLNPNWDFPGLIRNTDSIARLTQSVGLDIAILYEDQHLRDNKNRGFLNDSTAMLQAQYDMKYIKERYFSQPNYLKIGGKPILLDFGPQYFTTEEQWTQVFSAFGEEQPAFYALNYHGNRAGKNTAGEYAWIWKDYLDGLRHFYNTYEYAGDKIAVAYPGFVDYYKDGGWGEGIGWNIPHRGDSTFTETLELALSSKPAIIQLATWNDYGEGTMIEPTREFGYSFLTTLQRELGVKNLSEKDLALVFDFYNARIKNKDNVDAQAQLDRAFALIAALRIDEARKIIEKLK